MCAARCMVRLSILKSLYPEVRVFRKRELIIFPLNRNMIYTQFHGGWVKRAWRAFLMMRTASIKRTFHVLPPKGRIHTDELKVDS